MKTRKYKIPLIKEMVLAIFLFFLPFIISIHKIFNENKTSSIDFFGFSINLDSYYYSDQAFVWFVLIELVPLIYLIIFYLKSKQHYKLFLLPTIWWICAINIRSYSRLIFELESLFVLSLAISFISLSPIVFLDRKFYFKLFKSKSFKKINWLNTKTLWLVVTFGSACFSKFVPKPMGELWDLGFIKIGSSGFPEVWILFYLVGLKLSIVIPLTIWFFEEQNWWRYALLSPILVTAFQLNTILQSDLEQIDVYEIWQILPLLMVVLILLIGLSKNAHNEYLIQGIYKKTTKAIENKLIQNKIEDFKALEQTKQSLFKFKNSPNIVELTELEKLKNSLEQQLKKVNKVN
ncbi:hypothetical protein [Croceitalea vernalis]|uniref:Uncharacterized protein n=1 Tax=Croceitalea vernalis TaxID=3075599 RepID=A0ABU3BGX2_9FLAO|nr:hypothetical protein [Croceitalea sp. P007]MDT0621426.1 hypothetical protein [Croceitalea sp. P007]